MKREKERGPSGRETGPSGREQGRSTLGVHAGMPDPVPGAPVVPALVQSATFFGGMPGQELRYSRYGNNPNQEAVGRKVAALEGAEAGLLLASGMGATAMTVLAHLDSGDHVVASRHLYGTTLQLLGEELPRRGIRTTFVDPARGSGGWEEALEADTRLLFMEIPTNPTLRVLDPRPMVALARERGLLTAVDATFASPVNLRPLELGVDVVIHSATKYLGGHSDLVAGVVCGSRDRVEAVRGMMRLYGPAPDPHTAWLLDRGLRTLDVRVRRQNETALSLARWFRTRDGVADVLHPGLEEHPDHALAVELMEGFGGMLSVILEGGGEAADAFVGALEVAMVAPSLGGVESLVSQPRYTSQRHQSPEERARAGIPDGFVRISVGVEDPEDLQEDFQRGLDAAGTAG